METPAIITMVIAWTTIISFLVYFLRKAVKTQKKGDDAISEE
jgi:hypothetical protein